MTGRAVPAAWKGPLPEPAVRTAEDLREVLARPGCECSGPLYYMYRDVARTGEDRAWLTSLDLRFDITVIPPRSLGGEYVKTLGHYHPADPSGTGYPEVYEVLAGEAHYLIQTPDCTDVILIGARAGDVVVVPPGYGHVTINPSKRLVLEMANIVSSRFLSEYRGYEARHGAAYFELEAEGLVKNPAYPEPSRLRLVQAPRVAPVTGTITDPLYDLITRRAPILGFLNHPDQYDALFCDLYC
jgi:glucose-6-phosphate isomerase